MRLVILGVAWVLVTGILAWRWFDQAAMRRAEQAFARGDWAGALRQCRARLAERAGDVAAQRLAARAAAELGMFADADRYFRNAGGLLPVELRAHGEVLMKLRAWDRALVIFEQLIRDAPDDPELRLRGATLALQLGRYNDAVAHGREAVARTAGTAREPHSHYMLGSAYFARGDVGDAATHFVQALRTEGTGDAQLHVSSESLRLEAIDHLLSVLRIDEAREQFKLLPRRDPVHIDQLYFWGRLCRLSNDARGARDAWQQVLARQPDHFGALVELSKLELDEGSAAPARTMLERAAALVPDNAQAQFLLSRACAATGDAESSQRALVKYRELDARLEAEKQESLIIRSAPDHRDTQWFLARRALNAGDPALAQIFLRRAIRIDPEFEPAKELLRQLEPGAAHARTPLSR